MKLKNYKVLLISANLNCQFNKSRLNTNISFIILISAARWYNFEHPRNNYVLLYVQIQVCFGRCLIWAGVSITVLYSKVFFFDKSMQILAV